MKIRRPTLSKKVIRGIDVLIPAMSILLECPDDSELQECSSSELKDANVALEYLVDLSNWKKMQE